MINFLAELAERFDTTIFPTPSIVDKRYNVYEIDIDEWPANTYWNEWGGHYDSFTGSQIMLYFGGFLRPQDSLGDFFQTPNSMFITTIRGRRICLIHIPRHPWLFPDWTTSFNRVIPFLSNALDPENPSNNMVRGVNAQTRLDTPDFFVRISDNIAGITLNQSFSISLHNDDGLFDDEKRMNIFNTPLYLKKSFVGNPRYEDFKMIRDGLVENKGTTFNRVNIGVADKFRALQGPVCDVIRQEDFVIADQSAINAAIPLVFGTARIGLTRLVHSVFMTAENAESVIAVFDRNGERIDDFWLDAANKTVMTSDAAAAAVVTGGDGRIGHVVRWLFENKAGVFFNDTNFNAAEWNDYADGSFRINMAITGGNVRNAIGDALKNDMAFLVQQTDGRFNIRSYRNRGRYPLRVIPSETITKTPEKDYSKAQERFFSSCIITYADNDGGRLSELYDERANDAEAVYRRRVQRTFDTKLADRRDARILAGVLSDRYTHMRQAIKLAVGMDTSEFQLLDRVRVDLNINGRPFSGSTDFMITGINHAQDILELEEI